MRVRGLGYWIGAGLGGFGLVGILLWVSMVSARPGSHVMVPDQAADTAAENIAGPTGGQSIAGQQQAELEPVGLDSTRSRLRSRPVTGSDTDRELAVDLAEDQAADASASAEATAGEQSRSQVLRVETDGAGSQVDRFDDTAEATADGGKDLGTATSDAEPSTNTTAPTDKPGSADEDEGSTPDRSGGKSGAQPEADNDRRTTSSTAKPQQRSTTATTAEPTTRSTAKQTTTTRAPTTTATARPTTTMAPATTIGSGGGGDRSMEQRVIELTNDARRQAGCPALVHNDALRQSAYLHSKDMSDNDYFSHTGRDGSEPWQRMSRQGYRYQGAAENIAWGYRSPDAVVEGWMTSAGHRRNILNCSFTEIGVGFHNDYWTQNFAIPR